MSWTDADYDEHGMSESEFITDDEFLEDENFLAFRQECEADIIAEYARLEE